MSLFQGRKARAKQLLVLLRCALRFSLECLGPRSPRRGRLLMCLLPGALEQGRLVFCFELEALAFAFVVCLRLLEGGVVQRARNFQRTRDRRGGPDNAAAAEGVPDAKKNKQRHTASRGDGIGDRTDGEIAESGRRARRAESDEADPQPKRK